MIVAAPVSALEIGLAKSSEQDSQTRVSQLVYYP
jgi:hypothetical protein